jgi:hypothetical protein
MTNNAKDAKQGGLTLSFPEISRSLRGRTLKSNFNSVKVYKYPDKIYNKKTKSTMKTQYFMLEGWQRKYWREEETKYFIVKIKSPRYLDYLLVNVRGVLWIHNSHDAQEIPNYSNIYDQQGFAVKQFKISIK